VSRIVRISRAADAAEVREIYRPFVEGSHTSFETVLPSAEEMARRIETIGETLPWLVLEDAGEVRGYAYATSHRARAAYQWCCETSVYVREGARRSGVGRTLYRALLALLRRQGYYNAYGVIALPNPASIGLHEALGFTKLTVYANIGFKDGAWRDVGWWHLILRPPDPPIGPPIAFRVLDKIEVEDMLRASCLPDQPASP
jgi:phosphinothricin acetyltransferase